MQRYNLIRIKFQNITRYISKHVRYFENPNLYVFEVWLAYITKNLWIHKAAAELKVIKYFWPVHFPTPFLTSHITVNVFRSLSLDTCSINTYEPWHESMVYFRHPWTHPSNAHEQLSSGARCLIFGRTIRLLPYIMCANSEGSADTAWMPSMVAYLISTIISWAGSYISYPRL